MPGDQDIVAIRAGLAGRYRVLREIDRGGMATVYLGEPVEREGRVAIKVLRTSVVSERGGSDRFRREIHIAGRIEHPGVVPILDSGEVAGLPYCVMPYIEGPSLKAHLAGQGALPLEEAVDFCVQACEALAEAHRHRVIHRDVKPSNLLLSDGRVFVTDFGIARGAGAGSDDRLTASGVAIGTAGYMSPEQVGGEPDIDARSDLYSLGCVFFEMLTGEAPFTGRTREAVIAKQLSLSPPSTRTVRPAVPERLDQVVSRALARVPADRFQSADEFAEAVRAVDLDAREPPRSTPRRMAVWMGATAAIGALAFVLRPGAPADLDPSLYAVFPIRFSADSEPRPEIDRLLADVFGGWQDISMVDAFRMNESLGATDPSSLSVSDAVGVSRDLGAGRFVQVEWSVVADSTRLHAVVADARNGTVLVERTTRFSGDTRGALERLVEGLLVGEPPPRAAVDARGSRSVLARRAFLEGQASLAIWDLPAADSAFTAAARQDPTYGVAHVWTALTRMWRGEPRSTWSVPARQAALLIDSADTRSWSMSRAVSAEIAEDPGSACSIWADLATRNQQDYAAWFGYASCAASDATVVVEPGSPSGYAFQTSYHSALDAYQRAFRLHPAILGALGARATMSVGSIFKFIGARRRFGRSAADPRQTFVADPAWVSDSLSFVPYPADTGSMETTISMAAHAEAGRMLRAAYLEVAEAWVTEAPSDPDALQALAEARAMVGAANAIDALREARRVADDPGRETDLMVSEVWIVLTGAIPHDPAGVRRARMLADSVLERGGDPWRLAGLAALTGRAGRAEALAIEAAERGAIAVPPPLRASAPALLVLSALGGPIDRVRALQRQVTTAIGENLPAAQQPRALAEWAVRSATLAFATAPIVEPGRLSEQNDYLWALQSAWARSDTAAVVAGLRQLREARAGLLPGDVTLDTLVPEAWLWSEIGDLATARAWIDPTLRALPALAPPLADQPVNAASLVRALMLRAHIAAAAGDGQGADRWAETVSILWSDADRDLAEAVDLQIFLAR